MRRAAENEFIKHRGEEGVEEYQSKTPEKGQGVIKETLEKLQARLKTVQEALAGHKEALKKEAVVYGKYKEQGNQAAMNLGEKIAFERMDQISELAKQEKELKEQRGPETIQ